MYVIQCLPMMKKEIRTVMLHHMCDYLETKGVKREKILAGLAIDEKFLKSKSNWVDKKTMDELMSRASKLIPDSDFFYNLGVFSVLDETKGLKGKIIKVTETPKIVFYEVAILSFLFNKVYKLDVLHADDRSADITASIHPPHHISYDNCQYIRGLLAAVPEIFKLGLARINEPNCSVSQKNLPPELINPQTKYNSPKCHYLLSW